MIILELLLTRYLPTFLPFCLLGLEMQSFVNFINDVLSPISVVIGIITFFPILWIWWDVSFGRKRRHKDGFRSEKA